MKFRILSAIVLLCLVFSCFGCSKSDNPPPAKPADYSITALTVNGYDISAAELNYFYIDSIRDYLSQYGNYLQWYGLDPQAPLGTQIYNKETGETWADYFLDSAIASAKNTYALYSESIAAKHSLSKEEQESADGLIEYMDSYVKKYDYADAQAYLADNYGQGSDTKSYQAYYKVLITASSYFNAYAEDLKDSYTDVILRDFEGDEGYKYNSYSYASIYLDSKAFATIEELDAAVTSLSNPNLNSVEKLNSALASLEQSKNPDAESFSKATETKDKLYSGVNAVLQEWIRDEARQIGDITALKDTTKNQDVEVLNGYYIVLFQGVKDNQYPLANVRHILVAFEGGTYNSLTGQTTYTQAEKDKAKEDANKIYDEWLNGEKTEDSFAALAKAHTDDGNGNVGGIYYDIYPGQMVQTFNDWCFDDIRQPGDHGIVETEYGYHIMYYSGDSETSFRDYMVSNDKLSADLEKWQKELFEAAKPETIDTSLVNKDYIISG